MRSDVIESLADNIAARLAERIKDDLRAMEGTELHADLAVIVAGVLRAHLDKHGLPGPCQG